MASDIAYIPKKYQKEVRKADWLETPKSETEEQCQSRIFFTFRIKE